MQAQGLHSGLAGRTGRQKEGQRVFVTGMHGLGVRGAARHTIRLQVLGQPPGVGRCTGRVISQGAKLRKPPKSWMARRSCLHPGSGP
jgi:hypothetical protein